MTSGGIRVNVALASNGGTATASSSYSSNYGPAGAINGDRRGFPWGSDAGWNDSTPNSFPDWLEVQFAGAQTIDEIDIFSVQDNYVNPAEPTAAMQFTQYGLRDFELQASDYIYDYVVLGFLDVAGDMAASPAEPTSPG